jgi:hypoxanthine phosphoribosyltransferase
MDTKHEMYLSWYDVEKYLDKIIRELKLSKDNKIDMVVGITRGGLAPASWLANKIKCNWVETIRVQTRDTFHKDKELDEKELMKWGYLTSLGFNILVVDDIVDSGETFRILREHQRHSPVTYSSLLVSNKAKINTEHILRGSNLTKFGEDQPWICFPWEQ